MLTGNVGFLGAGAIAEALIRGILNAGVVRPEQVLVSNRSDRERLAYLARRYGVRTAGSKGSVVDVCQVLVVACKPKDVGGLLAEVGGRFRQGQILLSMAAGITTRYIEERVTPGVVVIRAMPNTSCQVGESATAICGGRFATPEAMDLVTAILGSVGQVCTVPEEQMDAVTGLSGSGPAYIYLLVEAMIEAGEAVGLSPEVARALTLQTVKGAAMTLAATGADPAELREQVTSPGGTTAAGLQVLREAGFTQALVRAIARATERSRELGQAPAVPASEVGD